PRTSCVCWQTPMDVLCVLNRQTTWDKITQTVHGKGQHAESKDQRADMCTEGQPRTSYSPRGPKSPEQSTRRVSVRCPRTNVLICVMMDSHERHVCADGHTRTSTDIHVQPRTQPTRAKITRTVNRKGQRAESKDQRADMCTDGQPQTSCPRTSFVCLWTHTDVLCVLTDTRERPVCADRHTRTQTDPQTAPDVLCVLADAHGRPVCTEQTAHLGQNHPNNSLRGPKSPEQSTGRVSVLSPRTNMQICVLMDSHRRPVCADGHTRTATELLCVLTDTHRRPVCADGHPQTATDILCVLTDTHGRPVCADGHTRTSCPRTSCVCRRTPRDPRTPTDVLCLLNRLPTWAKITQTVHGKGQRAESKDHCADMCTDGQPWTSCVC
ncbi:unnamed protein product, partial [Brassica rapa]